MVKISIILPCYKVEKYLEDCLLSIQKQTYTNWECLIVNDGSPENEREISVKWVEQDKRFVYYEKENGGVCDARNFGIERATGDYVYFMDSDDCFYDNNSLESYVKAIQEYPYDILMGSMHFFDERSNSSYRRVFEKESIKNKGEVISYLLDKQHWSAGDKMYRLEFLKSNSLAYTKGRIAEDLAFNFKAFYLANSFCSIGYTTYLYKLRGSSASFTDRESEAEEMLSRLEEIIEFHNRYRLNINQKQLEIFICKRIIVLWVVGYKFSSGKIIEIYKRSKKVYFSLFSDEQKAKMWFKGIRFECACFTLLVSFLIRILKQKMGGG